MTFLWLYITCAALIVTATLFLIPLRMRRPPPDALPQGRIDERDTMFSRNELHPGGERFRAYYGRRSDLAQVDERLRALPGLLSPLAKETDLLSSASASATFSVVSALHPHVEGTPSSEIVDLSAADAAQYVKEWATYLGARAVGITELRDYHLYSVMGRGDRYGQQITGTHRYAVALTVEMDHDAVSRAPKGAIVMESARQYLSSGAIAVQLAVFFRRLGYQARAHIDGNYQVVCPLVARDAGLGEIGRMGLLMTPDLGPRVRIAVVTTDMPLMSDTRGYDHTVIDFCNHCRKCAEVCPSAAIEKKERRQIGGALRWQISQERCFTYWKTAGTDCGRCMAVCPYSHPDTAPHRIVRRLIGNNVLFRRFAIKADNLIYGSKPTPKKPAKWQQLKVIIHN